MAIQTSSTIMFSMQIRAKTMNKSNANLNRKSRKGITLVELIISMTLTAMFAAGRKPVYCVTGLILTLYGIGLNIIIVVF